jgi:hypothetical protein
MQGGQAAVSFWAGNGGECRKNVDVRVCATYDRVLCLLVSSQPDMVCYCAGICSMQVLLVLVIVMVSVYPIPVVCPCL